MGGVLLLLLFSSCRQIVWVPFPPTMQQDKEPVKWNGTSDTTWYIKNANAFNLDTPDELAGLSELVNKGNTFEGKTIYLSESIDLSGFDWDPIGSNGTPFKGTFDGGNNTIIGFSNEKAGVFDDEGNRYFSAFFTAVDGGTVKNITFEDYDVNIDEEVSEDRANQRMISVAVGNLMNGGTVENVIVKEGSVISPVRVSGIVARTSGGTKDNPNRIIGCENYADVSTEITGSNTYGTSGGIVSTTAGKSFTTIQNVKNSGSITGVDAGGIVGDNQGTLEIIQAENLAGTIIRASLFGGGIIGDNYGGNLTIRRAENHGDIMSYGAGDYSMNHTFGEISIGGILGNSYNTGFSIYDSENYGTLSVLYNGGEGYSLEDDGDGPGRYASIGGIVGSFGDNPEVIIEDCYSEGEIFNDSVVINNAGYRKNRVSVGGIIGLGIADNIKVIDSVGADEYTYTGINEDSSTYIYGSIAGYLSTNETGKGIEVGFTSGSRNIERPFSIVLNSKGSDGNDTNTTLKLYGFNIGELIFGVNDNGSMTMDMKDVNIRNLKQSWVRDTGTYSLEGDVTIKDVGSIENLYIFADEFHSDTVTSWNISYTISPDITFKWSAGTLFDQSSTFVLDGTTITFNNKELISPQDKGISYKLSGHEEENRQEFIISGNYPLN